MKKILIGLLFLLASDVFAEYLAVLETISGSQDLVSLEERQYLTDVLRNLAVKTLPANQGYTIMTRENISVMLPPGKSLEECEGSCLAETGRNIAADYVAQARVSRFGTTIAISVELYETASGKFMNSFNGRGSDVYEVEKIIKEEAPVFFESVKDDQERRKLLQTSKTVVDDSVIDSVPVVSSAGFSESSSAISTLESSEFNSVKSNANELDSTSVETIIAQVSIPSNEKPSKIAPRKVIAVFSLISFVTGSAIAIASNYKAKKAYESGFGESRWTISENSYGSDPTYDMLWNPDKNKEEYKSNRDKAKSAQTWRAVGIGVAIAGGIGFGLSFLF